MKKEIFTPLKSGYTYVHEHPQLLMSMVLVIIIPLAFIFSGQQFLDAGRQNQERLEKERIGMMHDVFAAYVTGVTFDTARIQGEVESLVASNPDITQFIIAKAGRDALTIIAAHDTELQGKSVSATGEYLLSNVRPGESFIAPRVEEGIRYWKSYRLIESDEGDRYYLFTETSLAHVDALFAEHITRAYYWLLGILAAVFGLIFRHVRMIDYAYLYEQSKLANETKDLFTNMIAHELRAPLTAMRGYASMIRQHDGVPKEAHDYAVNIEDAAGRLVTVVSDLLDVARIQSGKMAVAPTATNVQHVIQKVIHELKPLAEEKNISLTQEGDKKQLMMFVDEKRLHQALINLINNSIKYTPSGSIAVEIRDLKSKVEIRVKDTGMGISAENQKKLFSPFFRVARSEVDTIVGTGLGMTITKQLIELMKGTIEVESIRGVGTHIVITLQKG